MTSETGPDDRATRAAATFWRWFVRHDRRLREAPTDVVTDEIFERVRGYCSARGLPSDLLGIEISREEGRAPEFVVTAYGMEEAFPVADARRRQKVDAPAGQRGPAAEVDLLAIEHEALVERPDLVEHRSPH